MKKDLLLLRILKRRDWYLTRIIQSLLLYLIRMVLDINLIHR